MYSLSNTMSSENTTSQYSNKESEKKEKILASFALSTKNAKKYNIQSKIEQIMAERKILAAK